MAGGYSIFSFPINSMSILGSVVDRFGIERDNQ
jgi:hypothetical protein